MDTRVHNYWTTLAMTVGAIVPSHAWAETGSEIPAGLFETFGAVVLGTWLILGASSTSYLLYRTRIKSMQRVEAKIAGAWIFPLIFGTVAAIASHSVLVENPLLVAIPWVTPVLIQLAYLRFVR